MSIQFKVTLSRYKDGETRFSTPQWLNADSFDEAVRAANLIVQGLRGADHEATYDVQAVEARYSGGVQCDGARMFETQPELSLRLSLQGEEG